MTDMNIEQRLAALDKQRKRNKLKMDRLCAERDKLQGMITQVTNDNSEIDRIVLDLINQN